MQTQLKGLPTLKEKLIAERAVQREHVGTTSSIKLLQADVSICIERLRPPKAEGLADWLDRATSQTPGCALSAASMMTSSLVS